MSVPCPDPQPHALSTVRRLSPLQEGSFMASLGMKCTSGSCLYEPDGPAPPAPVPHEHKTNLVRPAAAVSPMLHDASLVHM